MIAIPVPTANRSEATPDDARQQLVQAERAAYQATWEAFRGGHASAEQLYRLVASVDGGSGRGIRTLEASEEPPPWRISSGCGISCDSRATGHRLPPRRPKWLESRLMFPRHDSGLPRPGRIGTPSGGSTQPGDQGAGPGSSIAKDRGQTQGTDPDGVLLSRRHSTMSSSTSSKPQPLPHSRESRFMSIPRFTRSGTIPEFDRANGPGRSTPRPHFAIVAGAARADLLGRGWNALHHIRGIRAISRCRRR